MKVLYITTEDFSITNANNHLNLSLIEEILKLGNEVMLIQSKTDNVDNTPQLLKNYEKFSSISVLRKKVNKNNLFKRWYEENTFYKRTIKEAKHIKCDVVFYQSSRDSSSFVLRIKKTLKKPVLLNIQDIFPDSLVSTGAVKIKPIISYFENKQRKMYKKVDCITVLSQDMKNTLIKKGVDDKKIFIAYNWFEKDQIKEIDIQQNKFAKKYNLSKEKFTVQYAGNLGFVINYDVFIEVAKRLIDYKNIELQIVGNGSQEEKLKKTVLENGLSNVKFFSMQPLELVSDVYSYCDVCLIPLKRGVIYHSVPSKASIIMACKRPIILSCGQSDYTNLFLENNIEYIFGCNEYEKIANKIIELSRVGIDNEMVNRAYEYVNENFSQEKNTKLIIELLENISKRGE